MIRDSYEKMHQRNSYNWIMILLGFPVHLFLFIYFVWKKRDRTYASLIEEVKESLIAEGYKEKLMLEFKDQLIRKYAFFGQQVSEADLTKQAETLTEERFHKTVEARANEALLQKGKTKLTYSNFFSSLITKPLFFFVTLIPGLLMYFFIILYSNPFVKYVFERLLITVFVVIGVVILVFSILYISPFEPAANIIGETATAEQIAAFNHLHGLDLPYLSQLWNAITGILTFDLGASYAGNEDVIASIMKKFPITLTIALLSLVMAVVIAVPIGIISSTRPNSFFDYTFMFIALLGLSVPNFWQGLIFILNFSIKLQWLPATYSPQNWLSVIMPVIVLGTALTASVSRMTRSSMLEVINEDYIITAKAKGLNKRQVLWKHAVGNAMIPIVTVIGLLFGGMLGGAAVTEKVFNISGIGSYIVDKQFIPDIPSILGGVVYIAITISLINVIIDILYAYLDPRIRSKIKQY
ncbi:ABC transporter permease [Sporosarcina sp. Sa2YVA2]|uniref:ABC transporter permease n=1 Tax=Sporosarcina quadrami TaxID=2762234 RepID=A0ABR8U901_9BACL|nr:ABC transporter permease [Sporosarcina quadrami]MBD7984517.1 ABC transporter permease [Sporosarcina quadrami]